MEIAHNRPTIQKIDEDAVLGPLRRGYVAQGSEVKKFELLISEHTGLNNSCLVSNGTTALYLSLWSIGVGSGDEIVLPTYVCSALLNAIYLLGAKPVLMDVNTTDFNIQWDKVGEIINNRTKAIIVPHIHGMPTIIPPCLKGRLKIIEDCCTAFNSYIDDKHVGHQGDCSIFSFYATKYFTSGGAGGCISTNDKRIAHQVLDYREFDCRETYYPRFNFQMTDLQASMGVSQINRINEFTRRRDDIAKTYKKFFDSAGVDYQKSLDDKIRFNNYRFVIKLEQKHRDRLMNHLHENGIGCIIPIEHGELLHNYLRIGSSRFMNAEKIASTTLSLPIYPLLHDNELEYIEKKLKQFFQ